jgi:hypothetical protein
MYFQTVHGKNILQGYTSRIEANPLPPENMPGLHQLFYNDLQPDITYDDSVKAAQTFFSYYGLGYVVIDDLAVSAKTLNNTPVMLKQLFGSATPQNWTADHITSYQIPLANLDSSQNLATPLLVPDADWYRLEQSQPQTAYRWLGSNGHLLALVSANGAQNLKLELNGAAYLKPRKLTLQDANGHELAQITVGTANQLYQSNSFSLPAGENWLNLVSLDGIDSPATITKATSNPSIDTRALSVQVYKLRLH